MTIIKDDYFTEDNLITLLGAEVKITDAKKKDMPDEPETDPDEEEPEEEDITRFEAIAQEADKVNLNKRKYPKEVLSSALDKLQPKLKRKEVFAMSDHPSMFDGPRLGRIAAIVSEAALNDKGKVIIKGEFLDNDAAKEVKSLLKMGVKVGVSARGYGEYDIDSKTGVATFKDGYEIEGWDFVVYPAANAKVTHFESVQDKNSEEDNDMTEIRTLDGLRAAYPELVASLEKPLVDKVAELTTAVETVTVDFTAKLTAVETEKTELQAKFDELNTRNENTCKALYEATGKLTIAVEENTKMKADIAAAELKLATDALLKDNKYAKFIKIDAALTTIDAVKAFVDAETAKFEAFAAEMKPAVADTDKEPEQIITEAPKLKAEDTKSDLNAPKKTLDEVCMDQYVTLATLNSNKLLM